MKNKIIILAFLSILILNCAGCEKKDAFDYSNYLYKIWILKEWSTEDIHVHDSTFTFYINNIENGQIEGEISVDGLAKPICFFDSLEGDSYYGSGKFAGTIMNGQAECQFVDEYGNEGRFQLKLGNDVEATFKYSENVASEMREIEGTYIFRPYNLLDEKKYVTIEFSEIVDLDFWGKVELAVGKYDTGRRYHGVAYLINTDGDIFYEFEAPFRTGAWIEEAYAEDIDNDGMTDIKLIERFEADDIEDFEWRFLQKENGLFHLEK